MIVKDFGCLLIDNSRSKAYLQKLLMHNLYPEHVIYLDLQRAKKEEFMLDCANLNKKAIMESFRERKYFLYDRSLNSLICHESCRKEKYSSFNHEEKVNETLSKSNLSWQMIQAKDINDRNIIDAVEKTNLKYILFAGGGILKSEILSLRQRFIHIHPGYVPDVKGSMAIEWSILFTGECAVSAFFMTREIDKGDIISRKYFKRPELENNGIPPLFSSHIRSELLIEIVQEYCKTKEFAAEKQEEGVGHTYYKMHPALNNVVFRKCTRK